MASMLPPPHSFYTVRESANSPTRSTRGAGGPLSPTSPRAGYDGGTGAGGWPTSPGTSTGGLKGRGFTSPPASPVRSISSAYNPEYTTYRSPKVFGDPGLGLLPTEEEEEGAGGGGGFGSVMAGGSSTGGSGLGLSGPGTSVTAPRQKKEPFLRVRIGQLERNRKDMLVRFDASVSPLRCCTLRQYY